MIEVDEPLVDELLDDELLLDEELELDELLLVELLVDELELLDEELELVVPPQLPAVALPLTVSESMFGRSCEPLFCMRMVLAPACKLTFLLDVLQLDHEPVRENDMLLDDPLIRTAIEVLP